MLTLENRSFDHMLGCLSLEGAPEDIDGLRPRSPTSTRLGSTRPTI
ncbi:MAG: hypothetical protein JO168_05925 [Solirubrobacterales bacterium]|nr:hypothetical protein [Solirubrobacterales bacterium]